MKLRLLLFFFVSIAGPANARLTEKEADLIKRFGKVEGRSEFHQSFQGRPYKVGTRLQFRSDQWTIVAILVDDRCARITYGKIGDWTEEHLVGLLDRNGGYATYKEEDLRLGKSRRRWKQADGVTAEFILNTLELTPPLYDRRLAVLRAQAEAASRQPPKF